MRQGSVGTKRNVSGRSRFEFALNRYLEHVLRIRRDDDALHRRIVEHVRELGPGSKLEIDVVENLGPEQFYERYYKTGTPVVLKGLARNWPCVEQWSPAYFRQKYGPEALSVMDNDNTGGIFNVEELTVGEFMDMVERGDTRKHLRFGNLLHRFPELRDDFDFETLGAYMNKVRLGRNMGVFIGAKGTVTPLHAAPPDNLFTQAYGVKRWVLIPARFDPVLRPVMARSTYYWTDFNPDEPDYEAYPGARYLDYYDFELHPGDVLYNPPSYWHQVTNQTATIGVGFRWLSPMSPRLNFSQFLLFLLATNPPLWFVARNKKNYTRVLQAAERKNRRHLRSS